MLKEIMDQPAAILNTITGNSINLEILDGVS